MTCRKCGAKCDSDLCHVHKYDDQQEWNENRAEEMGAGTREESNAHAQATLQLLREAEADGIDVDDDTMKEYEEKARKSSDEQRGGGGA